MKKTLIIIYILTLIGGYLFVNNALKGNEIEIESENTADKHEPQEKPVSVTFILDNGKATKQYSREVQNNETVIDLIDLLRAENELTYEKVAYTYGTEIDSVNGISASEDMKWRVYMRNTEKSVSDQFKNLNPSEQDRAIFLKTVDADFDVTYEIAELTLPDNTIVTLKYTKDIK